ncbi:MAG: N-acetyl-gamma-glutamyl-phosphate reductase [Nitrospirae bacterium]|nr:N-acetyl-gamma-glutamyl-phosphate reductase [Nitrospirota bacterium]
MRIAILGATGYTGYELLRILLRHPGAEITVVTSERDAGKPVGDIHPSLRGRTDLVLERLDVERQAGRADVFFLALPNGQAMRLAPPLLDRGRRVIDLSADFRFRDLGTYRATYGPHDAPEENKTAVYGLCELRREEIRRAHLVANPGCYATSVILALVPFAEAGVTGEGAASVCAASGVSGAGRRGDDKPFVSVNEGFHAYNPTAHRHRPEIEQEVRALGGRRAAISFVPHLLPVTRGILSTIVFKPSRAVTVESLAGILEKRYAGEPFVRVRRIEAASPDILDVQGTNFCDLCVHYDAAAGQVIVFSALDNLIKGASGQAVQNMNLMCGLEESWGLL